MKRIFGFGSKRKGQQPLGSPSTPRPAGAYDLRQKDLGKLHRAAACGDLAQVRQGLKKHGVDEQDKAERTPLHLACANGHADVVTYLVENKCKLNLFDSDKRSPLMKAVQCQQEKCVAILLEHGADPNLADADGNTALHLAVISPNTSVAGLLLEHNANIDAQNKEGCTPLILAVSEHQEEIVEFLLKSGADVHARDQCRRTPLMTAASGGEPNLIKVLLRYGADVSHKDTNGWTAEDYAVISGYSSLSKELSEYRDWKNTGEASASGAHSTRHQAGACDFTLGAPAMDKGAADDFSEEDSISSEEGRDDTWHTSEEEQLDFTPKKLQKPNLTLLMNASQQYRKNNSHSSRIENPKSPKKCLRERTLSDANASKEKCGQLIQDVSDVKSLEEEEEIEEEEEFDEKDNGDYEAEEDEDLTQDKKEEGLEDSEMTNWKKEIPQPLSAKNPRLRSQRPSSVLESVDDEDTEEEQCEEVDGEVCEALKQEESSAWDSEEEEQEKQDVGEKLQTAVVEGALTAVEAEEDSDSPWDSEIIETDSGSLRKESSGVVFPAADRYGACSQVSSGEHNGFSEKPSNSQLKTPEAPEAVSEINKPSPENMQEKSDLLEEFGLGDAENIEGEYSGSTSHMSSSARKEDIKDTTENYGVQVMAKQDDPDKLNTPPSNTADQQRKQKLALRKNECLKMENESAIEEKDKKDFSPEKTSKLIKMPMKGKLALKAEVAKKNKRRTLKKAANQKLSSSSGNNFQVLDDSTSSEASQDEGRPAARTGFEKNKVSIQMDVTDDLDSTPSSDTTSEDVELPTSAYEEAMLLLEQLSVDPTGSSILLKVQNILLQYEQKIKHEKNRYKAVWREVRKLESEESKSIVEETQGLKSILAHQEVERKSDIQSLKCTLKQQEEKMLRLETLYEKTREELRRKEDRYCKEMEEKQQLELRSKNLEMEVITLRKLLRQVEEERDETQKQLSQEKSARALQEGILNNHLWRKKELEEETKRTLEKNSEESDTEREKDLLYKNQLLQDEIGMLRLELDQVRLRQQEEEGRYLEENEALKEKNEDLKKELKLNEEALTETVFQYNGQLNLLKTESAVLSSKLEQTKESKDRLETEIESFRSRLNTAAQELERHQSSKCDAERTFQRERDEWLRLQDKLHHDLSDVQETNKSLSQQLSKAESKANSLENELHQLKQTFREKTLLLEMTQKELSQAQYQAKECDHARQLEKDQVSKLIIKQESMQERLVQLQSENLLLRQQLEDMQNKGIIKEKIANDVQDRFNDIFNKLRTDTEKQVCLVEERNKELNTKCTDLREQVFKYETEKAEREGVVRQLQQELADALKKQSMSEASLEVTTRYRCELEEDKLRLQKELEKVNTKIQELEEQKLQSERCVHDLKTVLDNKEREVVASSQKLEDLLLASSGTNATIKQLEEHVQRLEIEKARLEATVQQQNSRTEALQRDLQTSASVHNLLEDLLTSLRKTQAAGGDHHQQIHKQNVLDLTSNDLHSMGEKQLKLRSHLEERVAQLDMEKAELLEQCENERKKVKKLVESKCSVELRLDQEMKRNIELQKECKRLKRLISRAMKKVRVYEEREMESQLNWQGEVKNRYSETVNEFGRLTATVDDLSQQLEKESKICMELKAQNHSLQEELSTMRESHEKLEKSECQLKEEVAKLKHHMETNMVDFSRMEQYKQEVEERAAQEIRQKLEEVNLFLQTQAVSQDRLEQIRASHHASLRKQLKDRIRDLECELDKVKNAQQDGIFQQESTHADVERYKELYLEELKMRRRLGNKLERANERLAEANAKLFQERRRNKCLFTSSIVSGRLAESPVQYSTEPGHLGNGLTLSRSLSLGGSFLSPTWNTLSSRNRVEAYVAKVRQELDEKITKEFERPLMNLKLDLLEPLP